MEAAESGQTGSFQIEESSDGLKPCGNSACDRRVKTGTYCARCQKRVERHGDPNFVTVQKRHFGCSVMPDCPYKYRHGDMCDFHKKRKRLFGDPLAGPESKPRHGVSLHHCANLACGGMAREHDLCLLCRTAIQRGLDPARRDRKYTKLCSIVWCPRPARGNDYCNVHNYHFRRNGDPLLNRRGEYEEPPIACTRLDCHRDHFARGMCLPCLAEAAETNFLFREFLPELPGIAIRCCIGRTNCRRRSVLFGRCPDCLYDWQFTTTTPRNFFKLLMPKEA